MGLLEDQPRTIVQRLTHEISERILSGEIPPGSRLQQNAIAEQFGTSSTPVREAFGELARQGLVIMRPHRGVEVFRPTRTDVIEASEVQQLLESRAVETSVPLLTDADLGSARAVLDELRDLPAAQRRRGVDLDTAFHLVLMARCPNGRLRELAESARRDTTIHRLVFVPISEPSGALLEQIHAQHEAIYDACLRRDAAAAASASVDHIRWSLNQITDRLR